MPRLWNETIAAHQHEVREAIMDATWALVTENGLLKVSMSRIAQETGIARATLYKYFPDVEAILVAWHERHVSEHLNHLTQLQQQAGPRRQLEAVLQAYARICHFRARHGTEELATLLHHSDRVSEAQMRVRRIFRDAMREAAASGEIRTDIGADELATYCIHALAAAGDLPTQAAVRRLVSVTLTGLRDTRA